MYAVHEGGAVAHICGHGAKQMPDALLMLNINLEISNHYNAAKSTDALFATAKFPRLHVALHYVHAILLIKSHPRNLIKANNIVLAHQTLLAILIVDEHLCDRSFAARNKVGIRRHLLKEVTLTSAARAKFHYMEVIFHKRNHAQQHYIACALPQRCRLQANAAQQQIAPLAKTQRCPAFIQGGERIAFGKLNFAQGFDAKWPPRLFFSNCGVICKVYFCIEPAREHAVMRMHHLIGDARVVDANAGQLCNKTVVFYIKARPYQIDKLDAPLFLGARLKQFFLARAHRNIG